MLDVARIGAISLDLDDTLWPIWPTIERAEKVLHAWLVENAPMAAALFSSPSALRDIRAHMAAQRPDLKHDLSALRRESIRLALYRAGENPLLAEPAFEAFFAERQRVELFGDVLPALEFLASRYPLVSLSNGNADLERVGLARYFQAAISAREFGVGKPDPRIFHAAAGAVDAVPAQVLHLGDDVLLDVLGALNAGMQTGWVNRTEALWPHEDQRPHLVLRDLGELCEVLR
ncbi:HAD family hydrolase [Ramlibacter tataouinensis]|uniref:Hydrolases (HAD superfamily)-like protein n=1 Tax=Ramlibacter tataouinensis (strain ATCC BAA-407 / DSM 14655 / LMG 21543 / TTB310) TaxID=365046 RepID=F5Y5G6_RAMTT|nr:HAD-IA family hydrolase [Ramlibacter tataouinensis]AEG92662.1 hydrolases (HAD superfamily)-like protein [Ramlibacter tataouinensis TTB310]